MTYIIFTIGRVLLGGYFIFNGYLHFAKKHMMTSYAHSKGVPAAKVMVSISGVVLILGGLAVAANAYPLVGLWILISFLIPTTFMMHNFWRQKEHDARMMEQIHFAKNIALIAALLMITALTSAFLVR